MTGLDRRTFLKTAATGALGTRVASGMAACALFDGVQAEGARTAAPSPLPSNEAELPQIKVSPWLKIDAGNVFLKGMAFDRDNNLLIMAAYPGATDKSMNGRVDRSILRITPQKKVTTFLAQHGMRMCDHAIHKDGRIFIACLSGELLVVNSDGSGLKAITTRYRGKPEELSDLTFDSKGFLYVTDFTGKPGNPTGGVYRYSPDCQTVESFTSDLVTPNGIAFTHDETALWISCSLAKEISYQTLDDHHKSVGPSLVRYKMSGPGGDGIRVDVEGNMYLAVNFEGRILIFNRQGMPVAGVLLPGRDRGESLSTSNLVFKPGTNDVYMVASGDLGGAWIYKFQGLAKGLPLFSHQ